ncbi:MAG: hypothetical protein ABMB14_36765 [Myxococcota bacterium]
MTRASRRQFFDPRFRFDDDWTWTFGWLFAQALVHRWRARGAGFREELGEILLRSGWQDVEGLGRDALGADLRDPGFGSSLSERALPG